MVKAAIIGCGSIAKFRHGPEYASNPDAEIAGFFDPIKERAREMADQFGGKVYASLEEVLADRDVDAVSVCTSNNTHASNTLAALNAGKHVLCEKPMATTLEDAGMMITAAKQAGKFLMIGHNQRLANAHVKAKKLLESGEMGRIISFNSFFGHGGPESWSADKSPKTWFFNKKDAIMGAMGDLGIHKADLVRWLIGDEIQEVTACVTTLDKRNHSGELIDVDDNAFCVLRSRSGIVGTLTASWTNYGGEDNSTILYCTNGVVKIYANTHYPLEVIYKNGEKVYYKLGDIQTNNNQTNSGIIDHFVASIVNGVPPEISGEEGLAALRIIFACMESSASCKVQLVEG